MVVSNKLFANTDLGKLASLITFQKQSAIVAEEFWFDQQDIWNLSTYEFDHNGGEEISNLLWFESVNALPWKIFRNLNTNSL